MLDRLNGKGTGDHRVRQQTLAESINCSGTGLHSGNHVAMTMHPAPTGTGIVFRRNGQAGDQSIPALLANVVDSRLCTTLGNDRGASVATVEHLMAALAGCNIDNAIIEVDGPEVPIMDGSAAPFVFLVECAGVEVQDAPRRVLQIRQTVSVGDSSRTAMLAPSPGASVSFEIDFGDRVIARQEYFVTLANGAFRDEISRARTFGFDHEVASLRSMGFARGGSLENAIVVSENGVLNDDGLRYEDEFVRHKVLDSIGDLYLAGAPFVGHFHGYRSGHSLTHALLRTLLADPDAWRMTTFDDLEPVSPCHAAAADEVLAATA